jgi:hypothetical protein
MMQTCTLSLIVVKNNGYDFRLQGDNCCATGTGIFQFRGREGMEFATVPFSARNLPARLIESQNTDRVSCTCKGYITFEENIPLFYIEDAEIQAQMQAQTQPDAEVGMDKESLSNSKMQPQPAPTADLPLDSQLPAGSEPKQTKSRRKKKAVPQVPPEPKQQPTVPPDAEQIVFENGFTTTEVDLDESEYIHIPF